jgi:hypothetical protein
MSRRLKTTIISIMRFAMGDIISLVYTAVIFAALIAFVSVCRKV